MKRLLLFAGSAAILVGFLTWHAWMVAWMLLDAPLWMFP